jgi:tetratricopeptide (TPR) repeat protein
MRIVLAVLPVLALLGAPPAHATDDAGTHSVFATGAGNRALGMGSAFVAAADDASALVWDPAGLGLVPRAELQVVQMNDLGLGLRQSYAALALPSWRFGTAGLAFRSFGTGGIERRDARNTLLDEFSDSEFEATLGYGRALSTGLALGGALKLQRQSLAGFSANGIGVDLGVRALPGMLLGVTAPWASRWSWALAVRNAVEPSLRLDRESVPDPRTVRSGMAWSAPTTGLGAVIAEVDVEAPRGAAVRLHAGIEYRPVAALALRAGSDGGVLTAGAGVCWKDLTVEYAFRDNPIATEHRVGLTLGFGRTVEQSRGAARAAEDAALQRRLAEVSRARQDEQVAALLERAADARRQGFYDDALRSLAILQTLAPGDARATALEARCLYDKAAQFEAMGDLAGARVSYELALESAPGDSAAVAAAARCRDESDRRSRRSNELRERFGAAMDALAGGDLAGAHAGFEAVTRAAEGDSDAVYMLRRTELAIARRVDGLMRSADREARGGRFAEAGALLDQCAALDPATPGLGSARAALARARAAEAAGPTRTSSPRARDAAPRQAPVVSERTLEQLYRQGSQASERGQADVALHCWELVWAARPDYREVKGNLMREYLTRGMEAFASGQLEDAVALWEKALRVDPGDERAKGYLARAQKQMVRSREIMGLGQ